MLLTKSCCDCLAPPGRSPVSRRLAWWSCWFLRYPYFAPYRGLEGILGGDGGGTPALRYVWDMEVFISRFRRMTRDCI